jgi:hypothetical protein
MSILHVAETRLDTNKRIGVDTNAGRTERRSLSGHQSAGHVMTAIKSFESAAKFRYLEMTLTGKISFTMESKRKFKSGKAYYHSIRNLYLPLLYLKIYCSKRTKLLLYLLYMCVQSYSRTTTLSWRGILRDPMTQRALLAGA